MSSGYPKGTTRGFIAGADLSALKYTFVKYGSDSKTVVACGNDEIPCGILMNDPQSGQMAEVVIEGGARLKSSGVIGLNASIGSAAGGQGKAITSGTASAKALDVAATNDVISVIVDNHVGRSV